MSVTYLKPIWQYDADKPFCQLSKTLYDLEKGVMVTQIKSVHVPTIYLC